MKYSDLTINQRISLKGYFESDKTLLPYKAIWMLWNFKIAVEYFLNGDINSLCHNLNHPRPPAPMKANQNENR